MRKIILAKKVLYVKLISKLDNISLWVKIKIYTSALKTQKTNARFQNKVIIVFVECTMRNKSSKFII
jgi:hypothetical protein